MTLLLLNKMGNLKSRLHKHKKSDRPTPGDNDGSTIRNSAPTTTTPGRNEVDQQIMSGPNRARQAEANPSDSAGRGAPPSRDGGGDTTATANPPRGRN